MKKERKLLKYLLALLSQMISLHLGLVGLRCLNLDKICKLVLENGVEYDSIVPQRHYQLSAHLEQW